MVTQKGQHKQWGKCHQTKKESVLKEETVNKIEVQDIRMECSTQRKIKYNANKKAQRNQKSRMQTKKHNTNKKA